MNAAKPQPRKSAAGRKKAFSKNNIAERIDDIRLMAQTMSDMEIAEELGVSKATWYRMLKEHPEIEDAVDDGRSRLTVKLKDALIKRALGYEYTESSTVAERVRYPKEMYQMLLDAGFTPEQLEQGRVIRTEYKKKYCHPDVMAIKLLLKNLDDTVKWSDNPMELEIRQKELELKEKAAENDW